MIYDAVLVSGVQSRMTQLSLSYQRTHFQDGLCDWPSEAGCWQEASAPVRMGLPVELLDVTTGFSE